MKSENKINLKREISFDLDSGCNQRLRHFNLPENLFDLLTLLLLTPTSGISLSVN